MSNNFNVSILRAANRTYGILSSRGKKAAADIASIVDFLGWVHFPDHRVLRTATKRRMFRRLAEVGDNKASRESYLGLMNHGNTQKLRQKIEDASNGIYN